MNQSTSGGGERRKPPPESYRLTDDLAGELGLSEGQVLRTRVVRKFSDEDDKILLNVMGKNILAQTKIVVQPGDSLIVRVQSLRHPIELSIYDPDQLGDSLPQNRLSNLLDRMGLPRSEKVFSLARNLIRRRVYLHPDLLRSALTRWKQLTDDEDEIVPARMDAFLFLYRNDLPPLPGLLERLDHLPEADAAGEAWRGVLEDLGEVDVLAPSPPIEASDLRRTLQRLGVDLIRQFGRRPHRASKTLHARLLASASPNPDRKSLLSRLLGLALSNLASNGERRLVFPLRVSGELSLLELSWRPDDSRPDRAGEFTGSLRGRVSLPVLGPVGFCLRPRGSEGDPDGSPYELVFRSPRSSTCARLQKAAGSIGKQLEKLGLAVTIQVKEQNPQFPDPFREEAETTSPITGGGVNLLA